MTNSFRCKIKTFLLLLTALFRQCIYVNNILILVFVLLNCCAVVVNRFQLYSAHVCIGIKIRF